MWVERVRQGDVVGSPEGVATWLPFLTQMSLEPVVSPFRTLVSSIELLPASIPVRYLGQVGIAHKACQY